MQFVYRFIARQLAKRQGVVQSLINTARRRMPYSDIMSHDGKRLYMRRAWLFNPYHDIDNKPLKRSWLMQRLPSIRIHEILLPDDDKHMHDHPWDAQTLILRGSYVEERPNPEFDTAIPIHPGNLPTELRRVAPGDSNALRFGEYHRIVHTGRQPVVTLFITFKYRGVWGFNVDGVKVPWKEYLAAKAKPKEHVLYKTGDADAPAVIRDRNGEVVLGLCKVCGRGENQLSGPCDPAPRSLHGFTTCQ